jgi:16S rRNA (guanine527-N7)-methyltransferase
LNLTIRSHSIILLFKTLRYNQNAMEKLIQQVQALLGIHLTARQVSALELYEEKLLYWNERINLTAIRDSEGIRIKHFLDSMSCYLVLRENIPTRLVDVGTGAGFPGIPLKILIPNLQLTLVESVGKKVDFCREVVRCLNLDKVEVIQARAEEIGQMSQHRELYDWAVARAVANLPVLAEYLLPLVHVGGSILSQKGESGPAEAHAAEHPAQLLGGHLKYLKKLTLTGVVEERYLVVIEKVAATPPQYPRRVGLPAKKPLV